MSIKARNIHLPPVRDVMFLALCTALQQYARDSLYDHTNGGILFRMTSTEPTTADMDNGEIVLYHSGTTYRLYFKIDDTVVCIGEGGGDMYKSIYDINNNNMVDIAEGLYIPGQTAGDVLYFDGSKWTRLGRSVGGYLKSGDTSPMWSSPYHSELHLVTPSEASSGQITLAGGQTYTMGNYSIQAILQTGQVCFSPVHFTEVSNTTLDFGVDQLTAGEYILIQWWK